MIICINQYVGWLGFYVISTFVGYLTPNPFLCKSSVLFQTIQFSMSIQFNFQKRFYFKRLNLVKLIQFRISTVFVYTQLNVKNSSISNNSV